MDVIRAEVERGTWVPPPPRHRAALGDRGRGEDVATFGSFARSQVKERRGEVRPATSGYWDWALAHLLPFFADWPLTKIDVWAVDAYRLHKLEESDDRRRRLAEGRAEELLEVRGQASLPPRITPHSFRHIFTSLLFAIGEDLSR